MPESSAADTERKRLTIMSRNFSGPGQPYPQLRRAFVYKDKPTQTPLHLNHQPTKTHAA